MFEVEYFTLSSSDSANRFITLAGVPVSPNNVAMDLIGGTAQALIGDFGVDSTKVKWDSTDYRLFNEIMAGDRVRVIYDRS
jgi:hypothetical protein